MNAPIYPYCSACTTHRCVHGDGPQPADILFLGEGPGLQEHRRLIPFCGPSGRELNYQYLPMSGLSRQDIRVTNAVKCFQEGETAYPDTVAACAKHHLPYELSKVRPKLIVTLGAAAASLFNLDLEMVHGRPQYNQSLFGWSGTVFPCYHPAAGMHKPEYMIHLQQDFHDLAEFRAGRLTVPIDEYPNPDYRLLQTDAEFATTLLHSMWNPGYPLEVSVDCETVPIGVDRAGRLIHKTWCFTFSFRPGTGYMILADNYELVKAFLKWLTAVRPLVIFHHSLNDLPLMAQLGISVTRFIDTMVEAYHLGNLAQGLKVLAYRLCGMVMQDFDDLVYPYAIDEAYRWLQRASDVRIDSVIASLPYKPLKRSCSGAKKYGGKHARHELQITQPGTHHCGAVILDSQCGKSWEIPESDMERSGLGDTGWSKADKILTAYIENDSNQAKRKYLWDRWYSLPATTRQPIEEKLGALPWPAITQAPMDKVIWYACRDADATLRIKPKLYQLAASLRRRINA